MKKNAMLKIAAILLVAVLLTTCAISATFAKYTTSGASQISARVAKWGVNVNTNFASENDLFLDAYVNETDSAISITADDAVVAPGAYNSVTITSVATGTPEVSGKILISASATYDANWTVVDADEATIAYKPLKFRVTKGTAAPSDWVDADTLATLVNGYEAATFAAGTDLSSVQTTLKIEWKWDFTTSAINDGYDTQLANKTTAPSISVNFNVTVEQTNVDLIPA